MSCQAKDLGQSGDAITLAQTAASRLHGGSARVRAILSLRAAEAHASAGDLLPTQRLIDAAFEQLRAGEPQPGTPNWADWLDETHSARVTCHVGKLVNDLAPYRHTPAVRELSDRIVGVLAPPDAAGEPFTGR